LEKLPPRLTPNCLCKSRGLESVKSLLALLLEAAHRSPPVEVRKLAERALRHAAVGGVDFPAYMNDDAYSSPALVCPYLFFPGCVTIDDISCQGVSM
jgi:hypothetical protein